MTKSSSRWWLTHDSRTVLIDASAETVYDLIADLPRMGEWSPECLRVEWLDDAASATVEARFVGHNEGGPAKLMKWSRQGRVLAAERGREFAFITEEGGRESTLWRYRFEVSENGTRVIESYEVKWIPLWARILDVPTNRAGELTRSMQRTLARLKAVAEGVAVPGGRS